MSDELWALVVKRAEEEDRPTSWVVRQALERMLGVADVRPARTDLAGMKLSGPRETVRVKPPVPVVLGVSKGMPVACEHRWVKGVSGLTKCEKCGWTR